MNIADIIPAYRDEINKGLSNIYPYGPDSLTKPVAYVLQGGGKRLRPLLTIFSAEACGGIKKDVFSAALAVEVLHNFTLVHDDIMDQDIIRHGQQTVHHKWDDGVAILTGDERVGIKSDRNIAQQLDDVISEFQPDRGILVTDGMEDESVLPILSSRLSIDHVEKIIVRQSKGIEGTYYYIAKAIEDPRWRARLLVPIAVFMMILGLGMILPNGAVLIGSMPLLVGVYLLFKGLGAEDRLERLMRDMRESADAAILSSLLWAVTGVAILLAVVEGYDTYAEFRVDGGGSNILMGLTVLQKSLTWIVLGALAFALSMMVLRWKKGNFSGRSVLIIAFGAVLWTMATAALEVAIRITDGGGYEYDVTTIMNDWGQTLLALFIFWALRTGVRSWESKQDTGRYWGV